MEMEKNTNEVERIRKRVFKHIFTSNRSIPWLRGPGHFKVFVKGDGIRVTDIEGRSYIDGAAGWQFGAVGHGRTEIADAIRNQAAKLAIVAPEFINIRCLELAEKLAEITPGDLTKAAFCSSGSEAVETAMKMAKQYHMLNGEPRRYKVISRRGSYHGVTWGAMSIQGVYRDRLSYFEPMVPMAIRVAPPYCYRCDYGLKYPSCDLQCARDIERVIVNEGPEVISAVIGEPVSHSCYVSVPPPEYWPMVRSICDKYGVLLINDCVITGFGRTGKWFSCEHWDCLPDIMSFAKGVTSGYIPLGGVITTPKIASKFEEDTQFANFPTWGGNPVSSAGALANIAIIEREKLVENSAKMGKRLLEGFKEHLLRHPIVGDIRGIGLMIGVEMVADKKTKEFFKPELRFTDRVFDKLESNGLLARDFKTTIILTPPLCISKSEVDEIIVIMDKVVGELAKNLGY